MNTENDFEDIKSKSALKAEMLELQALGEALLALPLSVYEKFPVPEELDSALTLARKITSHSAKRRQIQFIGRVMRNIDAEPLQLAYNEWREGNKKLAREHHHLEELRDQLIAGDKACLEQLIESHPDCDIQQLRQLIRQAQQEKTLNKPPKNYRKLFQFLKDL
jgi:ribosome-associated protein